MQVHGLNKGVALDPASPKPPPPANADGFKQILDARMANRASLSALDRGNETVRGTESLVSLGTITKEVPTVSELLYKSPFKAKCWNIVYHTVNTDKPFRKIKPGTEVMLNTATKELSWGKAATTGRLSETGFAGISGKTDPGGTLINTAPPPPGPLVGYVTKPENRQPEMPGKLVDAVRKFIGRKYDQMDCYELVVGGLTDMGVQYQGRGGLGEHLMKKASAGGFPFNHYLNGEGLVAASGSDIFKRRFLSIKDADGQAESVMTDLSSVLKEGQILSFSTRTRGHTGVISKREGLWTFINSGTMDNNLAGKNGGKQVGEENLKLEIKNWFRLASQRGEGLKISLGAIDIAKLAAYQPGGAVLSKKA